MGFHNCLGDREAHPGALYSIAQIAAAIELVEDQALLEVVNSGALVADAGDQLAIPQLRRDGDGRLGRRVLGGVLQ